MAIADKLNELVTQRNNLATNLNTMGVTASTDEKLSSLVPKVLDIKSGGSEITKGLIINACDSNGYVTDVSVVGLTSLPGYSFGAYSTTYNSLFSKYLTKVHLPNEVTSLGTHAFEYCTKLEDVNIPPNLEMIDSYCFRGDTNLLLTSLPDTITSIEAYAFNACSKIELTKLPNNLNSMGANTFQNCSKITISEIPINVTSLGNNLFQSCSNIETLDILSDQLTRIGNSCFSYCSKLETLIVRNVTPPTLGTSAFSSTPISKKTGYIYVPDGSIEAYQTATNWSTYASQIKGISELPTE